MPRRIKKPEAIEIIKSLDISEMQHEIIFRLSSSNKKRELRQALYSLIDSYIREERDVVVFAIKVK
jgi:hypothetical protein